MAIDVSEPALYTVKVVFHRAYSLPIADLPSRSSDPYVSAEIRPAPPAPSPEEPSTFSLSALSLSSRRRSFTPELGPPQRSSFSHELGVPSSPRRASFSRELSSASATGTGGRGFDGAGEGDPPLRFRTCTVQRSLNPEWESEWIVAGVPSTALIEARIYDEDSRKRDDLLGTAFIPLRLSDHHSSEWVSYKLSKSGADRVALGLKAVVGAWDPDARQGATLAVSVRVLGRTKRYIGRMYTVNSHWWIHYSPLVGSLTNTKTPGQLGTASEREHYDFQSNELQLHGPVPLALKHRFYPFKGFVAPMFEAQGLRGTAMHRIMRRQHRQIYHFDEWTKYGVLPDPPESRHPSVPVFSDPFAMGSDRASVPTSQVSTTSVAGSSIRSGEVQGDPALEMARRFLDMCYWGDGARIFTYVISRNGMMRFTETGPEFAIDLLSKHMMHADVDAYVAYSGEFFVRPRHPRRGSPAHSREASGASNEAEEDVSSMLEPVPTCHDEAVHPSLDRKRTSTVSTLERSGGPRTVLGRKIVSGLERLGPNPSSSLPVITRTLAGPEGGGSTDPRDYELVIDNESGTYRPVVELLPVLRRWLAANFAGLRVTALSGMDPQLKAWKEERRLQRKERNQGRVYAAEESDLESFESDSSDAEDDAAPLGKHAKGFAFLADPKGTTRKVWRRRREEA